MKFQADEKVLWWDGESINYVIVGLCYSKSCNIKLKDNWFRVDYYDLYHETPDELLKLKERIDELRYKFENISDELRHKIEEDENDVQA